MDAKKRLSVLIVVVLVSSMLSSCMNAAMTGAQVVYDRHNLQKTLNDHYITMRAYRSIYADTKQFKDTNVSVSTFNNVVLLAGQVPKPNMRNQIETIVKKIPDIHEIHNLITVSNPVSTLTQISDTWITTKIKAQLIAANEIDPSKIKVITENGTVYLIGIIPPEQAQQAVQIARTTSGVQNVIKVFSYLHISKT